LIESWPVDFASAPALECGGRAAVNLIADGKFTRNALPAMTRIGAGKCHC
jgi:hypothetical protein